MKKLVIALFSLLGIGATVLAVMFFIQTKQLEREKQLLIQQNTSLQSAVDAIGPLATVYTVNADVQFGNVIEEQQLVEQIIPQSCVNESYVTDKTQVVGKFYKVNVSPGTSLTSDLVMEEESLETMYERDLTLDYLPLGLRVGDYVSLRIVFPYGEEFIIYPKKRVYAIADRTIKLRLTEADIALWTSALTDYSLYKNIGLSIYATKYTEPGIAEVTVPYYPVRLEMEAIVTLNPNIANKKQCVNNKIRTAMEQMLARVTDQDGSNVASGKTTEASNINTAKEVYSDTESTSTGTSTEGMNAGNEVTNLEDLSNELNDAAGSTIQ